MKKTITSRSLAAILAVGLLAGCKHQIKTASEKFNELPPVVQRTVRAEAPNAEVTGIDRKNWNGVAVYEIEFAHPNKNPRLLVTAGGDLIHDGQAAQGSTPETSSTLRGTGAGATGTPLSALPLRVQEVVRREAPDAEIVRLTREERDGRVIYNFEFKGDDKNPTMRVAADGTIVQRLQKW